MNIDIGLLLFVFLLASFLGFELLSKVPSVLHMPLMSASNAISGIVLVAALIAMNTKSHSHLAMGLGIIATIAATINVVGGYYATDRILRIFVTKTSKKET